MLSKRSKKLEERLACILLEFIVKIKPDSGASSILTSTTNNIHIRKRNIFFKKSNHFGNLAPLNPSNKHMNWGKWGIVFNLKKKYIIDLVFKKSYISHCLVF